MVTSSAWICYSSNMNTSMHMMADCKKILLNLSCSVVLILPCLSVIIYNLLYIYVLLVYKLCMHASNICNY